MDSLTYPEEVLLLAQSVKITSAERQSAKVLVDHVQEVLCRRKTKGHIGSVLSKGVVGAFHLVKGQYLINRAEQLED